MVGHCNDIKFICKVISDGPHFRYLKGRLYTLPTTPHMSGIRTHSFSGDGH
jgi:hypothetical protein